MFFTVKSAKFLRTLLFKERLQWLLLNLKNSNKQSVKIMITIFSESHLIKII